MDLRRESVCLFDPLPLPHAQLADVQMGDTGEAGRRFRQLEPRQPAELGVRERERLEAAALAQDAPEGVDRPEMHALHLRRLHQGEQVADRRVEARLVLVALERAPAADESELLDGRAECGQVPELGRRLDPGGLELPELDATDHVCDGAVAAEDVQEPARVLGRVELDDSEEVAEGTGTPGPVHGRTARQRLFVVLQDVDDDVPDLRRNGGGVSDERLGRCQPRHVDASG
jgi:hypothetical protein